LGGLCVTHRDGGMVTSLPFTDWLQSLQGNPGGLACSYTFNNQTYAFPCAALANQLLLIWGCLDTTANPFAPLLAGLPGIVTSFDGHPVFDLPAMLIDPTAELTLDNLQPSIRNHGLHAGTYWYHAVEQCFDQHQTALQAGDVQIGAVLLGPCCGNGVLDQSGCAKGPGVPPCESCDDGNRIGGDGCTPLCRIEGRPAPLGRCGNGIVEHQDLEQCDDGNLVSGDGCEPDCRLTTGSPAPTATASATPTVTPRGTTPPPPTATATATRTRRICIGDCDANGRVTVDDLIRGVRIALDLTPVSACRAIDVNGDARVTIDELVSAVGVLLGVCDTE
jgi:cysteine-rich repeat protein